MVYQIHDCLSLASTTNGYIAISIVGDFGESYQLAFTDYEGATPPPKEYFENCSFYVSTIQHGEISVISFDAVTIEKSILENAPEVKLIVHSEQIGMHGIIGLTPMNSIADIAAFFKTNITNPNIQPDALLPGNRTVMPIKELEKLAPPINPFRPVQLYKQDENAIRFWQIYGMLEPLGLVVNWGTIGPYEGYEHITEGGREGLEKKYTWLIEEKRREGYQDWEDYKHMILQFKTTDTWGSTDDLEFRNKFWDILAGQLYWTGNGVVSGGDIGSGGVNLFFESISAEVAVETILSIVEHEKITRPFIVAMIDKARPEDDNVVIIYPQDYTAPFNY